MPSLVLFLSLSPQKLPPLLLNLTLVGPAQLSLVSDLLPVLFLRLLFRALGALRVVNYRGLLV